MAPNSPQSPPTNVAASFLEAAHRASVRPTTEAPAAPTTEAPAAPTVQSPSATIASVAKAVVATTVAQSQASVPTPAVPAPPPQAWTFIKLFAPAEVINFPDKTTYTFPLLLRNGGQGYESRAVAKITDADLAGKLRAASKANSCLGIVEVTK